MSDTLGTVSLLAETPTPSGHARAEAKEFAPLPAHAIAHRRDWWEYVLRAADPWHLEHLSRLLGHWDDANHRYYGDALLPPYILLSEPVAPNVYGDTSSVSGFGGRSQIRLRPSLLRGTHPDMAHGADNPEGRFRFVADVLLHEMIHQWQQEVTGDTEEAYHGHGPTFRDKSNEIGQALGLPPVRTSKKRGRDKDLPSCAQWPHDVRPSDYYLGAYVADSGDLLKNQARELAQRLNKLEQQGVPAWRRVHDLLISLEEDAE